MAPRGGKSSGGGGSYSTSSCPNAFQRENHAISFFVAYCIFFLVPLFTLIAMARIRKRHPGAKRLLGPVYIISLVFFLLANALQIISTLLAECDVFSYFWDAYKILIPATIFFNLAYFLLLVVVVFNVNNFLRQHHGHNPSHFKYIYGFVLVVVGGVTAGLIGVQCWNYSIYFADDYSRNFIYAQLRIRLAFEVLYMLAVITASVMATATIVSMRSRGASNRNLTFWTGGLMVSMLFWIVLRVADSASYFSSAYFSYTLAEAFFWLENIFQAFAWICLLFIAKSNGLDTSTHSAAAQMYNSQNPAYNPVSVPQQQQLPYTVHNGAPPPPQQQVYYTQQ